MAAARPAQMTKTELETLATMLGNAGRHMYRACNPDGRSTWEFSVVSETLKDMLEGFYEIQRCHAPNNIRIYIGA